MTKDEVVRQHYRLSRHEIEQTQGNSEGQREPGVLQSMMKERVRQDQETEKQQQSSNFQNDILALSQGESHMAGGLKAVPLTDVNE